MARKPNASVLQSAPLASQDSAPALTGAPLSADVISLVRNDLNEARDLMNQLLGQAQAFQAAGNLLQTFGVSKLAFVKENKLYRHMAGMKTPNGLEFKGTWVEFCGVLGISDEKANEDIANLQAFGEVALEQMQRVGIGYRDLRKFRRLPDDKRIALIEVAKSGDKDAMVEFAEQVFVTHAKEKEDLQNQITAKDALLKKEKQHAERLAKENDELHIKAAYVQKAPPDVKRSEIETALMAGIAGVLGEINTSITPAMETLVMHAGKDDPDAVLLIERQIGIIETKLRDLRETLIGPSQEDVAAWAN